jgi:hypothetical protein
MNFGNLHYFLGIKSIEKRLNRPHSTRPQSGPRPTVRGRNQPACGGTAAYCAKAKSAKPDCADGPRRRCHALGAVTARHGGASTEGSPAARLQRRQGQRHEGSGRVAPGNVTPTFYE